MRRSRDDCAHRDERVRAELAVVSGKSACTALPSNPPVIAKCSVSDTARSLQAAIDQAEANSVTAEITPRVRQQGHPKWLHKNVNDYEQKYVRLTGRLMLDTKHIPPNHGLKRATNWEVHPVTRFEVCTTTKSQCDQGSGWDDPLS